MASLEELRRLSNNTASSNAPAQSPADKLAAMRPEKPIPGRVITHSDNSSTGRIITESDHSLSETLQHNDE